jgi:hypothetical protein
MQKLIAASLWLLVAQTASATLLYVDYDGVIMESTHPDYALGDTFSGSLLVDTSLAPFDPMNSTSGLHASYGRPALPGNEPSADFVTGFTFPARFDEDDPFDYMQSRLLGYVILDAKGCATLPGGTACDADIRPSMLSISASLFNTGLQFSMLDAVQSFELTSSDEIGAKLSGTYYEVVEGVLQRAFASLSRLAVTPMPGTYANDFVCRP